MIYQTGEHKVTPAIVLKMYETIHKLFIPNKTKQRGTIKLIKYINQLQRQSFFGLCPLSRFYKHKNVNKSQMNSVTCNSVERQNAATNHKTLIKDCMHLLQLNHQSQEECSDPENGVAASSFMASINCSP
jgi:hypothetical protein